MELKMASPETGLLSTNGRRPIDGCESGLTDDLADTGDEPGDIDDDLRYNLSVKRCISPTIKRITGRNNGNTNSLTIRGPPTATSSLLLKREADLSIDQSGLQRYLPNCVQFAFADKDAEGLYREYYANEKRTDFTTLLKILLIVNLLLLLLYSINYSIAKLPQLIVLLVTLITSGLIYLWTYKWGNQATSSHHHRHHHRQQQQQSGDETANQPQQQHNQHASSSSSGSSSSATRSSSRLDTMQSRQGEQKMWSIVPYIVWLIFLAHIFCDVALFSQPREPSDSLALLLLYTYSIYVIFPLRLTIVCLLSIAMASIHTAPLLTLSQSSTASSLSTSTSTITPSSTATQHSMPNQDNLYYQPLKDLQIF